MVAIDVKKVTRNYQKYSSRHRFKTFKSSLLSGDIFRSLKPDEIVTALDSVTFSAEKGTTFGVIGENGSGKSTLLKIISGITKPTSGSVSVNGKVSALIELGAGFHPEITGRENVFINGIMLGLSKKEIQEKYDDIVRFAELEAFIDAPVKTYSSGMYMRLGFSVAINVNPDILLVDEVLAVGDASFVPKCIDRIGDFKRKKKTILFVSHDLDTVIKICDRVCWLKDGKVVTIGDPKRVVDSYLQDVLDKQEEEFEKRQARVDQAIEEKIEKSPQIEEQIHASDETRSDARREERWGKREIEIKKVRFKGSDGREKHVFSPDEGMTIELEVESYSRIKNFVFGIGIFNSEGLCCYGTNTQSEDFISRSIEKQGKVVCRIEKLNLINGIYYLNVAAHKTDGYPYDYHRNIYSFMVSSMNKDVGIYRPSHAWEFSSNIKISPPTKTKKKS